MRAQLDWRDPAACASWLAALDSATKDVIAVGEDQTEAPANRDLGRRAARRAIAESGGAIESLLAYARAGLTAPDGESDTAH